MTTAWLIAAVVVISILLGVLIASVIFLALRNRWLEGRIQSFGTQLRNLPKRKTDRVVNHED